MTFQEQLSAAAESYVADVKNDDDEMKDYFSFKAGARWSLQSELIKELEAALVNANKKLGVYYDQTKGEYSGGPECSQLILSLKGSLQKLKEARGEHKPVGGGS